MKKLFLLVALLGMSAMAADKTVYDFTLNSIDGQPTPLSSYKGKVVMLVTWPAGAASRHNMWDWSPFMKNTRTADL